MVDLPRLFMDLLVLRGLRDANVTRAGPHSRCQVDLPDHDPAVLDGVVDAPVADGREIDDFTQGIRVRVGAHVLQLLEPHRGRELAALALEHPGAAVVEATGDDAVTDDEGAVLPVVAEGVGRIAELHHEQILDPPSGDKRAADRRVDLAG